MSASPRLLLGCVVVLWTSLSALAAPSARLRIDPARIDALFKDYDNRTTPGCAVGIYGEGKVLYAKGYGLADLERPTPLTPTTLFDIASISKQFTAASLVLLAQEGKLALTDDIRKYLPEVPNYGRVLTLDHLLHHTSGLRDYNELLHLKGYHYEDVTGDEDALRVIARQRALSFPPGSQWRYSNTNYFLVALVVKRVTGKSLAEFAKERLFTPLGMSRSVFRDDHTAVLPGRALAYSPTDQGGFALDQSNWEQLGDGQVHTNVLELARWEENFYTPKVGGAALVEALQERGKLDSGADIPYGRGLILDTYRGVPRVSHSGGWAGYRSLLLRFPSRHVSVAMLCNRTDVQTSRAEKVADLVLEETFREAESRESKAQKPAPAVTPVLSADALGRYEGLYFSEGAQDVLRLARKEGALELAIHGHDLPLQAAGGERFMAPDSPLAVSFEGERLTLWRRQLAVGVFNRVEPVTLSAEDWKPLVGEYYSPELETTWRIAVKDGKAMLEGRALGAQPIEPSFADGFTTELGFLRMRRDGAGRPVGFVLQELQFERK